MSKYGATKMSDSQQQQQARLVEEKRRRIEELRLRKAARQAAAAREDSEAAAFESKQLEIAEAKAKELREFVDELVAKPVIGEEEKNSTTQLNDAASALSAPIGSPVIARTEKTASQLPSISRQQQIEAYEKGTQTTTITPLPSKIKEPVEEEVRAVVKTESIQEKKEDLPKKHEYSEEEVYKFLEKSSRLIERCLGERRVFDALSYEHIGAEYEEDDAYDERQAMASVVARFFSKGEHRIITQAKFWPQRPESILCAYAGDHGEVSIWSLARTGAPEARLGSQTSVRCMQPLAETSKLVIGGTDTGQIVVWDLRQPHAVPAQRTPLDAHAPHAGPIVNIFELPGDLCAGISSDGFLSTWSIAQLQRPVDITELCYDVSTKRTQKKLDTIFVSAADAIPSSSALFLGSDTGSLYQTTLSSQQPKIHKFEAHRGLVASVNAHPAAHPGTQARIRDLHSRRRSLVATSAVDWNAAVTDLASVSNETVATLDHGPHSTVSASQWSPLRSSLLATATSQGEVFIWNLGAVLDSKHARKHLHHSAKSAYKPAKLLVTDPANPDAALNSLDFSQDSKRILVGDLSGAATLLTLRDDLARPDAQDDARFDDALLRRRPPSPSGSPDDDTDGDEPASFEAPAE